ncbi:unnamed protein product, partial [Adineta steineri]
MAQSAPSEHFAANYRLQHVLNKRSANGNGN